MTWLLGEPRGHCVASVKKNESKGMRERYTQFRWACAGRSVVVGLAITPAGAAAPPPVWFCPALPHTELGRRV